MNVSILVAVFRRQVSKHRQFQAKLFFFFCICWRKTTANLKTFTEKELRRSSALHITSYLSIALSKILLHSKAIKNAKKLLIFGENDSCCLSNFLQTRIF